jgi:hypothetical protein
MSELYAIIDNIIENRRDETHINAPWVANEAMKIVDPDRLSVPCVYAGCVEHAKQYAMSRLRKKFEATDDDNVQFELFTELQWRYPIRPVKGVERSYVLRENMTDDDVDYNEERFLLASESLGKHARALRAWWNGRRKSA